MNLKEFAKSYEDVEKKKIIANIFEFYEYKLLPLTKDLPEQILQNDLNEGNIILDPND